jgi:hypothetical protein
MDGQSEFPVSIDGTIGPGAALVRGFALLDTPLLRFSILILVAALYAAGHCHRRRARDLRRGHAARSRVRDHLRGRQALLDHGARERYHQQVLDSLGKIKQERTLLSDYLMVQLPDEDWVALRDVYEVDGTTVADRGARMKALVAGPSEQLSSRVAKMAEESAHFNLGDLYYRTLNVPTFALRILRPASRKRMAFEKAGEEQVGEVGAWVVSFRETTGPTLTATPKGADVPAHGRFWGRSEHWNGAAIGDDHRRHSASVCACHDHGELRGRPVTGLPRTSRDAGTLRQSPPYEGRCRGRPGDVFRFPAIQLADATSVVWAMIPPSRR